MPAKNPRLSVVLTPAVASTLAALSEASGDSASSLVRGLLEQVEPALARMVQLVTAAKAAQGNIGAGVSGAMHRVVSDLEDAMAVADSRLQRVEKDLVDTAEAVKGRRRAGGRMRAERAPADRPEAASTPVPVTRGSGGPNKAKTSNRRPGNGRAV